MIQIMRKMILIEDPFEKPIDSEDEIIESPYKKHLDGERDCRRVRGS